MAERQDTETPQLPKNKRKKKSGPGKKSAEAYMAKVAPIGDKFVSANKKKKKVIATDSHVALNSQSARSRGLSAST